MSSRLVSAGILVCGVVACLHAQPQPAPDPILCWATRSFGTAPRIVVDLRLRSGYENRQPSAEDIRAVTALGGTVLHQFNVAVLRVSIDTGSLRQLLGGRTGLADVAYPVSDPPRRDVRVQVFYHRQMIAADDSALIALGAKGLLRLPKSPTVSATLADSLVPVVGRLPDVSFVRAQAMVCAFTTGASAPSRGQSNER